MGRFFNPTASLVKGVVVDCDPDDGHRLNYNICYHILHHLKLFINRNNG